VSTLEGYEALVARIDAVDSARTRVAIVRRWQLRTVRESKLLVPRKTGNLGRTIHAGKADEFGGTVVASADYARYVEEGTRGGTIIEPRPGRVGRNGRPAALAWGGARRLSGTLRSGSAPTSFARRVVRGATRAQPFLRPGAEIALGQENLTEEFVLAWNQAA